MALAFARTLPVALGPPPATIPGIEKPRLSGAFLEWSGFERGTLDHGAEAACSIREVEP
jgi:hypothetical protein